MAEVSASRTSSKVDSDVAVATHVHRNFQNSLLSLAASSAKSDQENDSARDCHLDKSNPAASDSRSSPSQQPVSNRGNADKPSGRPVSKSTRRKREEYDPELERLVGERVQNLGLEAQCGPTVSNRTAESATCNVNGSHNSLSQNSQVRDKAPPAERDDRPVPTVPAVPPRIKGVAQDPMADKMSTLSNHCLGSLPGGVCQQGAPEFVIDGEHDYINQDHLDAILEEQEVASEEVTKLTNGSKRGVAYGDDLLGETQGDAMLRKGESFVVEKDKDPL